MFVMDNDKVRHMAFVSKELQDKYLYIKQDFGLSVETFVYNYVAQTWLLLYEHDTPTRHRD